MGQLQEIKSLHTTEEAKLGSLKKELQDTSQELSEAAAQINQQVEQHASGSRLFLKLH